MRGTARRLFVPRAVLTIILRLCPHRPPTDSHGSAVPSPLEFAAMRKMLLALVTMFFMAGLVVAVELVSYDKDKKELKWKDGDNEKTGKIDDKTKFITTDKNGENAKDSDLATFEKRAEKSKNKNYDITVKDGVVTEVKWKGKK
jgi:hypothetical protein